MKIMVYYLYFALLFSCIAFVGCSKVMDENDLDNEDRVLVKLNFTGEVNTDESPMTKAFSSGDLLGIQVKEGSNYYAYGLFDDPSKVSIYLHSGKTYSIECNLVKEGKSRLTYSSGYYITINNKRTYIYGVGARVGADGYGLPFLQRMSNNVSVTPLSNSFTYSSDVYLKTLNSGQLTIGSDKVSTIYSNARVFYGKRDNIIGGKESSIPLELKSGSFGIKLSVSGITDGNVTVTIKNSVQTFHTNSNITQDTEFGTTIWTFYDLASAWQYADNYAENFTVGVVWNRGVGVTQDLGTKTVQFKRNAVNHVKINLSTSTKSAGLAVSLEEPEITNETYSFGN